MAIEIKHYKPGDEGFEEIAKQITQIERIGESKHSNFIYAEIDPAYRNSVRRKETAD